MADIKCDRYLDMILVSINLLCLNLTKKRIDMKYLISTFLVLIITFSAKSQITVNEVSLDSVDEEYIQIVGYTKGLSMKLNIAVDYGQEANLFKNNFEIKNSEGKGMKFNTMITALNFFNENGWRFVSQSIIMQGNSLVTRYLLQRKND